MKRLLKWIRPRYTVEYSISVGFQLLSFEEKGLTQHEAQCLLQSLGAYRYIQWRELRKE